MDLTFAHYCKRFCYREGAEARASGDAFARRRGPDSSHGADRIDVCAI